MSTLVKITKKQGYAVIAEILEFLEKKGVPYKYLSGGTITIYFPKHVGRKTTKDILNEIDPPKDLPKKTRPFVHGGMKTKIKF